jgi:hypothetical protein
MVMSDIVKLKRQKIGLRTMTEEQVKDIQSFYDEGNGLTACQKKYGYCRSTLIKYLKTRPPYGSNLSDEERRKNKSKAVVAWRIRAKEKLVDYKGGKCIVCGYNKYVGNLSFHHLNSQDKDFNISGKSFSIECLKKEVDKCVLLCHICHGELHAGLIKL